MPHFLMGQHEHFGIFHPSKQTLCISEEEILLTYREAQLLDALYRRKNELTERSIILNRLWGNDDFFNARSMDVFITRLRKKLGKDERVHVRGFGYKLIC